MKKCACGSGNSQLGTQVINQLNCNTEMEKWKEKFMSREEKSLSLEDMKVLIEKIHAAQQAGNEVMLIQNNSGTVVCATRKGINGGEDVKRAFLTHDGLEIR